MTFDALTTPLQGRRLIEASAGTGKTWTIAWLFVRWLVEEGVDVGQVLVVTFTEAAAEELRDRLRRRLGAALEAVTGGGPAPDRADEAARRWASSPGLAVARERLERALRRFDEALITTIHGFCFRSLSRHAFEARQDFEVTLQPSSRDAVARAAREGWTEVMRAAPGVLVARTARLGRTIEVALAKSVGAQPVELLPAAAPWKLDAALADLEAVRAVAAEAWRAGAREVALGLPAAPTLNRTKYQPGTVADDVAALDELLAAPGADPGLAASERMRRFTPAGVVERTRKGQTPPSVPQLEALVPLLDAAARADAALAAAVPLAARAVVEAARTRWDHARPTPSTLWFDDLLIRLEAALRASASLASLLREQRPVALIDEFQDTDPTQWSIFCTLYPSLAHHLTLIGDPKQAIYRFRGADLPTYFAARRTAVAVDSLAMNFRSDGRLLDALERIYTSAEAPFLDPSVSWSRVRARHEGSRLAGPWGAPVQILRVQEDVAGEVAEDLVRALRAGLTIDGAPVRPGDLAVLADTHVTGEEVRDALAARGIPAVRSGHEPVFRSEAAAELRIVLDAALAPSDPGAMRAALATRWFGWSGAQIAALEQDEAALSVWLDRWAAWRERWEERGVARVVREIMDTLGLDAVVGSQGGERRVTDLRQLVELASRAEQEGRLGPLGVRRWLAQRAEEEAAAEEAAIRLESDASAVRVVTLHASKGLEYGLVWIVGLHRWPRPESPPTWTDGTRLYLDLAAPSAGADASMSELRAERMRLAYVGLTRARHTVHVVGPAELGTGKGGPIEVLLGGSWPDGPDVQTRALAPGRTRWWEADGASPKPEPPSLRRRFGPDHRLSSFSALVKMAEDGMEHEHDRPPRGVGPALPLAGFPRGAEAGTAVHAILEQVPAPDILRGSEVARQELQRHGIDPEAWLEPLLSGLDEVVRTPILDGGTRLVDVPPQDRVDELEFALDVAGRVAVRELAADALTHGGPAIVAHARRMARMDAVLDDALLQGFIDLVFRAEGRYWVVDYKTNHLGDAADDYDAVGLDAAMVHGDYLLQAALYTLAVHRHLAARLPDYDYDRHVGGIRYLFVRGMRPDTGASRGVWSLRPSRAWIEAWDRRLGGGR